MFPGRLGKLCGWALQGYSAQRGYSAVGLGGWALQGYFEVGHCRDTLQFGTAGFLGGWALQGNSAAGHCRDTLRLGTAGIRCH